MNAKPCIIRRRMVGNSGIFDAFNEDGRFVFALFDYENLSRYVEAQGYEVVPLNSRCGRTILDKVNGEQV